MRLKPTKSVGLGDITSFVIKGCSLILSPVLKHKFSSQPITAAFSNMAASGHCSYPPERQQCLVSNCRPVYLHRNFCKLLEIVVYECMSRYLKHKLNYFQCGFLKYKHTFTYLLTCLNYVYPLTMYRCQVGAMGFDLSFAFYLVPHQTLLKIFDFIGLLKVLLAGSAAASSLIAKLCKYFGNYCVSLCSSFQKSLRICPGASPV